MSSEKRVCLFCSSEIPKWRAKNTKHCSIKCKVGWTEKENQRKKEERKAANPKTTTGSILHQCLSNALDAAIPCKCRKRISDEDAKKLVAKGGAVDYTTRAAVFVDGQPLLITGKHLKFPRAATIERPHAERATQDLFTIKGKVRVKERTIEEMQKAIVQDKLERAEEELLRMDIYQALSVEAMRIVQVPAEQYDEMKANDPWRGRCPWENGIGIADERSSVSKDVSEPRDFLLLESEVLREEEEEIETDQPEHDEEEDSLTVVTVEEMAGAEM
jgi:hypothetical protein